MWDAVPYSKNFSQKKRSRLLEKKGGLLSTRVQNIDRSHVVDATPPQARRQWRWIAIGPYLTTHLYVLWTAYEIQNNGYPDSRRGYYVPFQRQTPSGGPTLNGSPKTFNRLAASTDSAKVKWARRVGHEPCASRASDKIRPTHLWKKDEKNKENLKNKKKLTQKFLKGGKKGQMCFTLGSPGFEVLHSWSQAKKGFFRSRTSQRPK